MAQRIALHKSGLSAYPLRLTSGTELKAALMNFAKEHKMTAPFVLTACGSLSRAGIRFARKEGGATSKTFEEQLELLSLTGTLAGDKAHLHISVADKDGHAFGGHAVGDLIVAGTTEVIVAECHDVVFDRQHDAATGFQELVIKKQ